MAEAESVYFGHMIELIHYKRHAVNMGIDCMSVVLKTNEGAAISNNCKGFRVCILPLIEVAH